MNYQGYRKHILQVINNNFPFGTAFFTDQIAKILAEKYIIPFDKAKKITNVNLKRIADKNEIERFQKGVYYRAKQTVFGKTKPNPTIVLMQQLTQKNDEIVGYETGAAFFHKIGLTSLMPRDTEIATNYYRRKPNSNCHVMIKKPVTKINNNNYKYLQFIDAVEQMPEAYIDAGNPEEVLLEWLHANELNKEYLIYYTKKYYSEKTLFRLIDIILEVGNDIT